jgi:hypothetical protein
MIPFAKIFLSHSSKDKPFARRLAEDLKRYGATLWLDEEVLEPGGLWKRQLGKSLSDNDFVVVILSPASINSAWVQYEVDQALAQGKREGRIKLVPVLHKGCNIPRKLQQLQVVDFSEVGSYRRCLQRLIWTFERSWTHPRHQRRPWTKRCLRLALSAGVLREFNGQIVFGASVAERLRIYGARWLRGRPVYFSDHVFSGWEEYSGVSVLHAIDRSARLTVKEEVSLAHESHEHLLDFLLDLGAAAGVLEDSLEMVKLSEEMSAEMQKWLPRVNDLGFTEETGGELRAAVTLLFVELIRERLISRVPEMASFAEPLGIVIHDTFGFWTGWNSRAENNLRRAKIRVKPNKRGSRSGVMTG